MDGSKLLTSGPTPTAKRTAVILSKFKEPSETAVCGSSIRRTSL